MAKVNIGEFLLKRLLKRSGFCNSRWQEHYVLPDCTVGSTTPDVTFDDPDELGRYIYTYLDGLSANLHSNADTRTRDMMIRHFRRLARMLEGREGLQRVAEGADEWFSASDHE